MSLTLYYASGACSLVPHIALEEAGADFSAHKVDFTKGEQRSAEYLAVNPHGRVPALAVDDRIITELPAIVNYLGARYGGPGSVPQGDLLAAARANELIGWCGSTVHIAFAHVFRPERFAPEAHGDALKATGKENLAGLFAEIEGLLDGGGWLGGGDFTAADSYVFAFYRWGRRINMDMSAYPGWIDHTARMLDRPTVQRAIATEGLSASEWIGG